MFPSNYGSSLLNLLIKFKHNIFHQTTDLHDGAIIRVQGAPDDGREGRIHHLVGQTVLLLAESGRANHRFENLERDRLESGQSRLFRSGTWTSFEYRDESRDEFRFERAETTGSLSQDFEDVLGQ